jgi:hypothetical protein
MDKIYVQVPAYRDRELEKTLLDLYAKAEVPERLRVRVLWQRAADDELSERVRALPGLEIADVLYTDSRGCNWARNLLQREWRGERYTLMIDSHHRFVRGWDSLTIGMFEGLRARGVAKPVLTTYLPAYEPAREPHGRRRRPYRIYPFTREEGILTRLISHPIVLWTVLRAPVEADFASLHFLFADGAFNDEVRFDPDIYFFGDEVLTGLRAFTSGYDLFHPHIVLGWHSYDRNTRVPHWDDHSLWYRQHQRSLVKLRAIFSGSWEGTYGLGSVRTVSEYEDHTATDLIAQ